MKSIFISGGCGGFGLAVARIFRNEGYISSDWAISVHQPTIPSSVTASPSTSLT
ncbi:hypothetical protein ACOI9D_00655 [Corynebacterium striatum]|uniref:hypothetical protein n=1 Tax=Corynebacterium striatum TaxID=43770 RepID=UPI001FC83553|nr:hypothetical protein [Corynebacterium striatum]